MRVEATFFLFHVFVFYVLRVILVHVFIPCFDYTNNTDRVFRGFSIQPHDPVHPIFRQCAKIGVAGGSVFFSRIRERRHFILAGG